MRCPIVLKTNSSYSYLWPIIRDLLKDTDFEVILCCDSNPNNFQFPNNFSIKYYDSTKTYTQRLSSILNELDCDYICLVHDVDLILNLNYERFDRYLSLIENYDIHRLSLGIFNNRSEVISIGNEEVCRLTHITPNFFTPYDYAPSIYNRKKLIQFFLHFKNDQYSTLEENVDVQQYFRDNMRSFGIQYNDTIDIVYHRGFSYSQDFNFLHLTVKGQLLKNDFYFDLIDEKNKIVQEYNLDHLEVSEFTGISKQELI